jgi:hypothetical protein
MSTTDPVWLAWPTAPLDDEPVTAEDLADIEAAHQEYAGGSFTSLEDLREELSRRAPRGARGLNIDIALLLGAMESRPRGARVETSRPFASCSAMPARHPVFEMAPRAYFEADQDLELRPNGGRICAELSAVMSPGGSVRSERPSM